VETVPLARLRHAIILAAGMGTRLESVVDDRPKGLIEIDGETLVGRSVRLLRERGMETITIVVGHRADAYARFAAGQRDIHLIPNDAFATSGSMASLAVALASIDRPVLVLESDLVYESRALDVLLASPFGDVTLVSGPTGAGDEVWVDAPDGRLRAMSKAIEDLAAVTGEFVGISRLSPPTCVAIVDAFQALVREHGHRRMSYETDGLVRVSHQQPIAVALVPDLCWGEVDDDRQLTRVVRDVWPVVAKRDRQG
jgi:2-aminoethylphosphonate-pyruvate transaminase